MGLFLLESRAVLGPAAVVPTVVLGLVVVVVPVPVVPPTTSSGTSQAAVLPSSHVALANNSNAEHVSTASTRDASVCIRNKLSATARVQALDEASHDASTAQVSSSPTAGEVVPLGRVFGEVVTPRLV